MDEVSLHSLLSLEKALFQCRRQGDVVSQPDTMEVIDAHTHECSPDVMKFYWNINATIEDLLLKDITEAKFRLRHAVINNNLLFVVIFLRHTGEVDAMDENKQSLLHWSTTAEMVNLLLSYGANIHHLAVSGRTALHSCSTVQATEALLLAGLSPHVLNQNHGSPLHNGFISSGVTRMLLKHGADPNTVNYYGHTPLHVVASRGSWWVVCDALPCPVLPCLAALSSSFLDCCTTTTHFRPLPKRMHALFGLPVPPLTTTSLRLCLVCVRQGGGVLPVVRGLRLLGGGQR